jgi:hypothetical protein
MITKLSLALVLALTLPGCVTVVPTHDYEQVQKLDFSRVEQAEDEYEIAIASLEQVKDQLSHVRPDPEVLSQAENVAALVVKLQDALKTMRSAYDHKDAVTFERAAGESRLLAQKIYGITSMLPSV